MKKNLYYNAVFRRKNKLKEFLYNLFLGLASWPRLLLEVFVRKNMGERYFSFSTAVMMMIFLFFWPYLSVNMWSGFSHSSPMFSGSPYSASPYGSSPYGSSPYGSSFGPEDTGFWHVVFTNSTWYLFLAGFFYACLQRRKEVKHLPSVFDFARFSLSTGEVHPKFWDIKINGTAPDIRKIHTLYEPAFFLLIGLVLALFHQRIGGLITFCSLIYSGSYFAAYHIGDHFIMDTIDEMICNEEMVDSFVNGKKPEETRGFSVYGRRPDDPDMRRRVADDFMGTDDGTAEAS